MHSISVYYARHSENDVLTLKDISVAHFLGGKVIQVKILVGFCLYGGCTHGSWEIVQCLCLGLCLVIYGGPCGVQDQA